MLDESQGILEKSQGMLDESQDMLDKPLGMHKAYSRGSRMVKCLLTASHVF